MTIENLIAVAIVGLFVVLLLGLSIMSLYQACKSFKRNS